MKKVFSILMIVAMMLPVLAKIGILIDFKINQDFIAETLCVNIDEPILMCSGRCYLADQLKKAGEREEEQIPSSKKERLEVVQYHSKSAPDFFLLANYYGRQLNPACAEVFYTSSFVADIFRPPKLNLA
ncbi:MAG: hypothetical protein AAFZ63_00380 [Bacteroidota bacterium]